MKLAVQEKIYMLSGKFATIDCCLHSTNHIMEDETARHDLFWIRISKDPIRSGT
jgi:hypothetical protein